MEVKAAMNEFSFICVIPSRVYVLCEGGTSPSGHCSRCGPSFSILGSSHPVIERVLGDVQLLTDVLGLHLGLLHLESRHLHRVGALLSCPLDTGSLLSLSRCSRHDGSFVASDGGIRVRSRQQYTGPGPSPCYWSK